MPSEKDSENTSPRLFNFLYRDQDALNSYYAQAFDGVVKSVQQGNSKTTSKVHKSTPLGIVSPILKYSHERQKLMSETDTQSIDPHDIITLDVLQWLEDSKFIKHDISLITEASFLKITGDVLFIDQNLLTLSMSEGLKMFQNGVLPFDLPEVAKPFLEAAVNVVRQTIIEPSVLLAKDDIVLLGEIKSTYLSNRIANRYMTTGGRYLTSVTMIGLVTGDISYTAPEGSVLASFTQLADSLADMFSLHATHTIQPLVIYQELTPGKQRL